MFKIFGGKRPSKPANALELGLSDKIWKLLEDCWQTQRTLRPSVRDVLDCAKAAALVCDVLSPVRGISLSRKEPQSEFNKFGRSFPYSSSDVELMGILDQLFLGTTSPGESLPPHTPAEHSYYTVQMAKILVSIVKMLLDLTSQVHSRVSRRLSMVIRATSRRSQRPRRLTRCSPNFQTRGRHLPTPRHLVHHSPNL